MTDCLRDMKKKPKQVVLIGHGLLMNSQDFVFAGNGDDGESPALPYQLADTGRYDVWLVNFRGNGYSQEHMWMSHASDAEFWQYSFEEFGKYDLKAAIEFI